MDKHYDEMYHRKLHKNLLENKQYYLFRADYAAETYLKYLKGRIFELGCGLGQNIYKIKEKATGIDIAGFAVKECKKRGINAVSDIDKLNGEYDGCLSVHVFEHLENPSSYLEKINDKLNNNGRIVLVLPVFKKNTPENGYKKDVSSHLYYWNFNAINLLLARHGFRILHNEFNYARGFSLFYKLPYRLAKLLIKILGLVTNTKEMIIVAEKSK